MIFKRTRTIETTGELGRAWYSIRWLEQVASTPGSGDSAGYHTEESCTQYNVLKIVRHLFRWAPSAALGDDYEHKVNNGVLGIQKSGEVGQMVYMTVSPVLALALSGAGCGSASPSSFSTQSSIDQSPPPRFAPPPTRSPLALSLRVGSRVCSACCLRVELRCVRN